MRIGFIGVGRMGRGMVTRLLGAGHQVVVYNRTRSKAESLAERGALVAETPADAARGADALVTMLADDAAVEQAMYGEHGAANALDRGRVHISSSTISPALSRRMADAHAAAGQLYVAAPVLGRPEAAEAGELVIIAAGATDAIDASRPIFDAVGKKVSVLGAEPEKANVAKLAVNFVLASTLETLGEAYALAESAGVDDGAFLEILNEWLFKSPVIDSYGRTIAQQAFEPPGFRLSLGAKDMRLAVDAGEHATVPMPLGSALRECFVAAMAAGHADEDWAAVGRASTLRLSKPNGG